MLEDIQNINTTRLCNCSICKYTEEKLLTNKVLILYSSHIHTLILPSIADINLLHTISTLSNQLKILDLSFSMCVDDEAIATTIGKDNEGTNDCLNFH